MSDVSTMIVGTGLYKEYESGIISRKKTYAVNGVDIVIHPGETYVLLGESGSGKSTLGKILLLLTQPTSGTITFFGESITQKTHNEMISLRKKIQIIPQYPEDAFNPRWKVSHSILEPFRVHKALSKIKSKREVLLELLQQTGLDPDYANRYPHQLSGGELQRAAIARAIALEPDFIVCDEPTSMLDVSVQASIIHLLKDIQKRTGLAFLFITHDILLAKHVGDRIGVMYNGHIVEEGSDIIEAPSHPYTRSLVHTQNSIKKNMVEKKNFGCPWQPFCNKKEEICFTVPPLNSCNGRKIRCHFPDR